MSAPVNPDPVMDESTLYWDPFDIVIDAHPYDTWRRLRDEAPLYRNDTYDFWAISRFSDVNAASRDPLTFSSAKGTVLEMMGTGSIEVPGMVIFMDPPEHDDMRALVSRAFTPRRIAQLEDRIRAICAEHLDPHVGSAGFDYLVDFGAQLPSKVISALLGVPASDQPHVLHTIDTMFHIEPGVGMLNDVAFTAQIELGEYVNSQLAERRRHPQDDMFTALTEVELKTEEGARKLTDDEAAAFAVLLVSAGTETVARLLGWAAVVLDNFADERAVLVDDPAVIPNAVEELLRFEAPSPVQGRTLTEEVTLHGETLPVGARV
ncbi:MAG TPA: cytochrome P450, partial [Mycobacteriales bacterium]|nr:cytochrome P450 [Mycobacteriales bacterium]